jgi:hypothetical protein
MDHVIFGGQNLSHCARTLPKRGGGRAGDPVDLDRLLSWLLVAVVAVVAGYLLYALYVVFH